MIRLRLCGNKIAAKDRTVCGLFASAGFLTENAMNENKKSSISSYGKTTQTVKENSLFGENNMEPYSGKIIRIVYPKENSPEIQLLWEEP